MNERLKHLLEQKNFHVDSISFCTSTSISERYVNFDIRAVLHPEYTEVKEPINELENMINTKMNTQNTTIQAIKDSKFIVGSVSEAGELSFSPTPVLQKDNFAARGVQASSKVISG